MPTPCANLGGASASVWAGGPSRGRMNRRYTMPYGAYRSPARAPVANTSSCAASSQALPVISTSASTTTVITAPNLGPRGSMSMLMLPSREKPRKWLSYPFRGAPTQCRSLGAGISRTRRRESGWPDADRWRWRRGRNRRHAVWSASSPSRTSRTRCYAGYVRLSPSRPGDLGFDHGGSGHRSERGDHVGLARQAHGPPDDGAVGAEHEHGGGAVDAQPPHQVQPRGRVDLDVPHAVHHARHLRQDLPCRPARRAEGGRELDQGGPLAQRAAEIGLGQGDRAGDRLLRGAPWRRGAEPPRATAQRDPQQRRHGQGRGQCDQPASHAHRQHSRGDIHSRGRTSRAADQVGVMLTSSLFPAVISNLLIGPALLGIEPSYHTLPSSLAVVQEATKVRLPSGWTTQNWQVVPSGMRSTTTWNAWPHSCLE